MSTTPELSRLRTAFKFSLWTWAAYWPGCGLLLLVTGMTDPVSLMVVVGLVAQFAFLFASGAYDVDPRIRRGTKEILVDRPLYLVAGLIGLAVLATAIPTAVNTGFLLFSGLQLAGVALVWLRLREHLRQTGQTAWAARADQLFLLLPIIAIANLAVVIDAFGSLTGLVSVGNPSGTVALVNWINLAYPPILMLATKGLREPLRNPFLGLKQARAERRRAGRAVAQPTFE